MPDKKDTSRLLSKLGLTKGCKISKTRAAEVFQLDINYLKNLPAVEVENPVSPSFSPTKLFNAEDVAKLALSVNPDGGLNESLRLQREEERRQREERVAKVHERNAEAARLVVPQSPEERLCKAKGVPHFGRITKSDAMKDFNLDYRQLEGLKYTEKPNPRNPRFAKMKLYLAKDVASRAFEVGAVPKSAYS